MQCIKGISLLPSKKIYYWIIFLLENLHSRTKFHWLRLLKILYFVIFIVQEIDVLMDTDLKKCATYNNYNFWRGHVCFCLVNFFFGGIQFYPTRGHIFPKYITLKYLLTFLNFYQIFCFWILQEQCRCYIYLHPFSSKYIQLIKIVLFFCYHSEQKILIVYTLSN